MHHSLRTFMGCKEHQTMKGRKYPTCNISFSFITLGSLNISPLPSFQQKDTFEGIFCVPSDCPLHQVNHHLQKLYSNLHRKTQRVLFLSQKEIGGALLKRKGGCGRRNSMLIPCSYKGIKNEVSSRPPPSLTETICENFDPFLSFIKWQKKYSYAYIKYKTSQANFQVRDFYVQIFPTVFFVTKAASLGRSPSCLMLIISP